MVSIVALLIKYDSPGPIIYGSPRVGKNGKSFRLLRFRTGDLSKSTHLSMNERLIPNPDDYYVHITSTRLEKLNCSYTKT